MEFSNKVEFQVNATFGDNVREDNKIPFNPLSKIIGSETDGKGARTTAEFLGNQSTRLRKVLNIPDLKVFLFCLYFYNQKLLYF